MEKIAEKNEYIQDCSQCHLAVKVGLFGVLLSIVASLAWEFLLILRNSPGSEIILMPQAYDIYSYVRFIASLLTSIGFVGVFSMKGRKIGIIFPIFVVYRHFNSIIFTQLNAFFSLEFLLGYDISVGAILAIISCWVLLTIRQVSANPHFLTFYAFYYILETGLPYALHLIFPDLGSADNGLSLLLSYITSQVLSFVSTILVILFFALENRMGCIDPFENQTDSVALGKTRKKQRVTKS